MKIHVKFLGGMKYTFFQTSILVCQNHDNIISCTMRNEAFCCLLFFYNENIKFSAYFLFKKHESLNLFPINVDLFLEMCDHQINDIPPIHNSMCILMPNFH